MKPKTLCLSFFMVGILLASEMPSVYGMYSTYELVRLAANELIYLSSAVANGISNIFLGPSTIPPTQGIGSESRESETYVDTDYSQETEVTNEDNEMNYSAEKNGNESGESKISGETDNSQETEEPSEKHELMERVLNLEKVLNFLKNKFRGAKGKQSKSKHKLYKI
nr:uncharacterized protein LOC106615425 [Bactrocera oleae]